MKEKKEIEIIIAAQSGTGKSSVLFLLKEFFKEKGIEYSIGDLDFPTENDMDHQFKGKEELYSNNLKERVKLNLKTLQTSRVKQKN